MNRTTAHTAAAPSASVMLMFICAAIAIALMTLWAHPARAQQFIPASFADVAAKSSPAVVNISTEKKVPNFNFHGQGNPEDLQQFFEKFFGMRPPSGDRMERSLGSGFFIDPNGLIITNNHVIEDAEDIVVRVSEGKEYHAEVLGRDPKTDLALIRIKDNGTFPFLKFGDSDKVKIGDWVVAVGNPFGLDHTVTAGILSARGRAIGAGPYDDFLQTDASINPGNSGGPLLNLDGEVIGINSAIIAQGQGIGFAIPANMATKIVAQLRDKGKVVRGWLGVLIQKVTPELAKSFNLEDENGALVADVTPDSPAAKAGLERGDVIVEFNGRKIDDWNSLPSVVADTPVGATVDVKVVRNGSEKSFRVIIGELNDEKLAMAAPTSAEELGLTVRELTPDLASKLGLAEVEGVVIASVEDGGPAAEAGMKPGDLILEINRQPVDSLSTYNALVGKIKKGDTVLFLIRRGGNTLFNTLEMK